MKLGLDNILIKYGFLYTLANGTQKGIGFICFIYLAHVLSVSDYATFSKYFALFTIISAASSAGVIEVVISKLAKYDTLNKRNILFSISFSFYFILGVISLAIIIVFKYVFYTSWDLSVILIIHLNSMVFTYFLIYSQLVRLNENHKWSIIYAFVPTVSGYLLGLILVYLYKNAISFFIGSAIGHSISLFLYFHKESIFVGISKKFYLIRKNIKNLLPFQALAFVSWLMGYGIVYIVDILFREEDIAIYMFLYTISSIIQLIGSSLNQVWSPKFYKDYSKKDIPILEKEYSLFTSIQGLSIGIISLLLIISLPHLVMLSESFIVYVDKTSYLSLILLGYAVSIPWWHAQNYYIVNNMGNELMKITVIASVIGLTIWYVLMLSLGVAGIYWGFFINSFIRSLLIYIYSKKYWNITYSTLGQAFAIVLIILTKYI